MRLQEGKEVAHFCLNVTLTVPEIHPIITENYLDVAYWKAKIDNANSLEELVDLFKPQFKLKFIQLLSGCLDITYKDLGNLLIYCWNNISSFHDNLYFSKEEFLRCLHNSDYDKWMTEQDKSVLQNLPDAVIVYRGASVSTKYGLCWTLSFDTAKKYASRYGCDVYTAIIPRNAIMAYLNEDETVILHYRKLENLKIM